MTVFYPNLHPLGFTVAVVTVRVYLWHRQRCSKDPRLSRSTQPALYGMTGSALHHCQGHGLTRMGTDFSIGMTERALRIAIQLPGGQNKRSSGSGHEAGWVEEL